LIARSSRSCWVSPREIAPRRAASRLSRIAGLTSWFLAGLLGWSLTFAGQGVAPSRPEFDRAALDSELSRPLAELRQQGSEALRSHVQRLTEIYATLDGTDEIPPAERRAIGDRILARVAQIGLQARDDGPSAARNGKARGWRATALASLSTLEGALGFLGESSVLLVGLLGGLIVAYSLGRLAGYRRGASEASYYGAGDPRLWFVTRARDGARPPEHVVRITLDQVRRTLADGRTVLLQLGYEIAPRRREEFLGLIREMHLALNGLDGHVYSAWEDPRHPNRFYEVVVCHRLEALDLLTSDLSELAGLDAKIEACWLPGRPVLRRAWWGVFPERDADAPRLVVSASSGHPREDRVP
jgi:hypothetical protein